MNDSVLKIVRAMSAGGLSPQEQEDNEYFVIQELCGTSDPGDLTQLLDTLSASGTVLSVPALCAIKQTNDEDLKISAEIAIDLIKSRARRRGSILPNEYFTVKHWKPEWRGSVHAFLSYVQVIADNYIKAGHEESEENRIGEILAKEMSIDLSPYQTYAEFKVCQTDWDLKKDYEILLDRMAQEKILLEAEEIGIKESAVSTLAGSLMDLQYDYLAARLKLKGNLAYYRFAFKMAESMNVVA